MPFTLPVASGAFPMCLSPVPGRWPGMKSPFNLNCQLGFDWRCLAGACGKIPRAPRRARQLERPDRLVLPFVAVDGDRLAVCQGSLNPG